MIQNKKNIDDTDSIILFIDLSVGLFDRFLYDCGRLLVEIPNEVKDFHVDMLNEMIELSKFRKDACVDFKREHIIKQLRDESMRSLLDDIYGKTRDGFEEYMALGGVSPRLKTYIGTKLIQKSEKKTKSVAAENFTFPTPPRSKWDNVEIRFVTETAAIITVKDIANRVDFAEAETGFKNKQNGKFTKPWGVFKQFAELKGVINYTSINRRNLEALEREDIYRLKKILSDFFGIPGKPISDYDDAHAYTAFFHISIGFEDDDGDDINADS